MLRKGLRLAAGLLLGAVIWWYATPAYDSFLAFAAQPLVHLDHRYERATLTAVDRLIHVKGRAIPFLQIPADQITANFVLLIALFAMRQGVLSDRGILGFALSFLVVFAVHVLALTVAIEATWAARTPVWGDAHYSGIEQDFWTGIEFLYRIAGMFAIPFACFWLTAPDR